MSDPKPLCLTRQELEDLAGYKQGARPAQWLKAYRFAFKMGRDKRPRVDRSHYLLRMCGQQPQRRPTEPNWAAIAK